jgi:DNA polymerase-3 subunit alpha
VDLRLVNRRALESLIKAGALSPFGTRAQLLAVADRMLDESQKVHGTFQQASFFGLPAFVSTGIQATLPQIPDVSRREVLVWEKELIGAYISEHPLSRVWADLEESITVLTGQIDETMAGQNVTVAGLVNFVRQHVTKKGDAMAFAQIEDLQGPLEVVIFPRVWEQSKELWKPEHVLIVRGKVSFRGRDPSLLVESATNEITTAHPREPVPSPASPPQGPVHLHISIPRTQNLEQVIQRLGQIYDLLQDYPGQDCFSLYVENGGQGLVRIDFPNNTTSHCVELEQRLRALLGAGTIRVESNVT